MYLIICFTALQIIATYCTGQRADDIWQNVQCDEEFYPKNCDINAIPLPTVEDFERCSPALLPLPVRNYYLAWSGSGTTYRDNKKAFDRIRIKPKMFADVSKSSLDVRVLGKRLSFPIGIAPTALQLLADPEGENATAAAAAAMNTVMIVSISSSIRIEEIAARVEGLRSHLWMQVEIYTNRSYTIDLVRRAEECGFEAVVMDLGHNFVSPLSCNAREDPLILNAPRPNRPETNSQRDIMTASDMKWLKSVTSLPIVAKGILTGRDARKAIQAGASAICVSNTGGIGLDGVLASIDALPDVVQAVNRMSPRREVYLDGGIRNGYDVYKAMARGAQMVFIGRPQLWGLAMGGSNGVKEILAILKDEFNSTMLLAGASNTSMIKSDSIVPANPVFT